MVFKLVVLSCLLALVYGSVAPAGIAAAPVDDPLLQYKFGYDVADALTGDYKSQTEERDGDLVRGQYTLLESDGTRRVVTYTADSVNGFNAIVRNEPVAEAAPAVIPARITAAPAVVTKPAIVAETPVVAEPAVVSVRIAAAPIVAPSAAGPAPFIRYTTAPAAVGTVEAESVFARYATVPAVARYVSAPVIAANYGAPIAAAYRAAYTAPVSTAYSAYPAPYTAAYTAPFATTFSAPFASAYSAPFAVYGAPVAAPVPEPGTHAIPTSSTPTEVTTVSAAPAKLEEPVATVGHP